MFYLLIFTNMQNASWLQIGILHEKYFLTADNQDADMSLTSL